MQVEVTRNGEASEATIKIAASAEELQPFLRAAAKKLSAARPLKGFRPGKAPLRVVQEALGSDRVLNEALEGAVPRLFVRAVLDENIEAIDRPKVAIERMSEADGLTFTATVSTLPAVTLGDLESLRVVAQSIEVTDAEIAHELLRLARTRSTFLEVVRPAQNGDTVTVDFLIYLQGELMEGGESKNHPIHLGEGHFVPDFEKRLLGSRPGEAKEFPLTFPVDYARESLRGKQAQAKVVVHSVQQRITPAIDDAFAQQLGDFKDLAALKYTLKSNIILEKEARETDRRREALAEQLAEGATFAHIPEILITKEVDQRMQELDNMLAVQRKTLAEYLAVQAKDEAALREELWGAAEKSVRIGLALRTFAEMQAITVSDEEVAERVSSYLTRFASAKEAKEKIDIDDLKEHLTSVLRNQKTLEQLEKVAGEKK